MLRHYIEYMLQTPEIAYLVSKIKRLHENGKLHTSVLFTELHCSLPELERLNLDDYTLVFREGEQQLTYQITENGCVLI